MQSIGMVTETFERKIEGRITVYFSNGREPQALYYTSFERRSRIYECFIKWDGYAYHDIAPGVKRGKRKRRALRVFYHLPTAQPCVS